MDQTRLIIFNFQLVKGNEKIINNDKKAFFKIPVFGFISAKFFIVAITIDSTKIIGIIIKILS